MQILQLCHKIPQPARDGGALAMQQITDFLQGLGWKVKVLAVATEKHPPNWDAIPAEYIKNTAFECVQVNTRFDPIKALLSILTGTSYNVNRFYNSSFSAKLRSLISQSHYDLVLLEGLYLTPYIDIIRRLSNAKIILRAHNVEHQIWMRRAESESNPFIKAGLSYLSHTLRKYEVNAASRCDGVLAITPLVQEFFKKNQFKGICECLPFSSPSIGRREIAYDGSAHKLFFLGALDWKPNLEGILWFLKNVWPLVLQQEPSMVFHVAGRNFPKWLKKTHWPQVVFDGEVSDAEAYASDKPVMVVPLLSGSGVRVKIIEGLAWGKTIITTSVGSEGTGCIHNQHLLAAQNAVEMASQIVDCFHNPFKAYTLAKQGNAFVMDYYNQQKIVKKLESFCEKLIMLPKG